MRSKSNAVASGLRIALALTIGLLPVALLASAPKWDAIAPAHAERISDKDNGVAFLHGEPMPQGYVEEEFFISGDARQYGLDQGRIIPTGKDSAGSYTTRALVRRPRNPAAASGVVVVEHLNNTAGYDLSTWPRLSRQWAADGVTWVAFTGSSIGVATIKEYFDPKRYARLNWPRPDCPTLTIFPGSPEPVRGNLCVNDGWSWDIISQLGSLVRAPGKLLPADLKVRRVYLSGWSQSGGYIATYVTWFHSRHRLAGGNPIFDGYLYGITSGWAQLDLKGFPTQEWATLLKGIDVPIILVNSETDVVGLPAIAVPPSTLTRRADSDDPNDRFRLYEVPGSSHVPSLFDDTTFAAVSTAQLRKTKFPLTNAACVEKAARSAGFTYIVNAAYRNLDEWVTKGTPPPRAPRMMVTSDTPPAAVLDEAGNAKGGVRTPYLDQPAYRYAPTSTPRRPDNYFDRFVCAMQGNDQPLSREQMHKLYRDKGTFVRKFTAAANAMVSERWWTRADADLAIEQAEAVDF